MNDMVLNTQNMFLVHLATLPLPRGRTLFGSAPHPLCTCSLSGWVTGSPSGGSHHVDFTVEAHAAIILSQNIRDQAPKQEMPMYCVVYNFWLLIYF